MPLPVVHLTAPIAGSLYAVGDLHGCYDQLLTRLRAVGFDAEKDLLISVGDLVDRGSQNLECIALLQQPWFKAIRGNHEQLCIDALTDERVKLWHLSEAMGGTWFHDLDEDRKTEIAAAFSQLPIILEVQHRGKKYGFVHADIDFDDWEALKYAVMARDEAATQNSLWGRLRFKAAQDDPRYPHISGIDTVYLGHNPIKTPRTQQNCHFIDTGAVYGGDLTVVRLG